jgi:RAB protein geranylgeranyltransferase component A
VYSSFSYRFSSSSEPSLPPVSLLAKSQHYAISLSPSLVPSDGSLIDALVQSEVSRYGEFRLVDALGLIRTSDGARTQLHLVPSTKEDIFKDKEIPLIVKRKFMKMLQFAIGEYENSAVWRGET